MRRRIVRSTTAITVVCVAVLGLPLGLLARHQVLASAAARVHDEALGVADAVEDPVDAGRPVDLRTLAARIPGHRISVAAGGRTLVAGPALGADVVAATVAFDGGSAQVEAPADPSRRAAAGVALLIAVLAVLAVVAATALAEWQGRRLSRPLGDLATATEDPDVVDMPRSGVAEIDELAVTLERSRLSTAAVLERQRDFAADAAHQLRTPLTGIGLRLEELVAIGDETVRAEATAAQAQVERLEATFRALLARARGDAAPAAPVDLGALTDEAADPWRRLLAEEQRSLSVGVVAGVVVHARADHVRTILSSLLDNAVVHGQGDVRVEVSGDRGAAWVQVSDAGPGVTGSAAGRIFERSFSTGGGDGIGLTLAASLAAGEGGRVHHDGGSSFRLELPAVASSR